MTMKEYEREINRRLWHRRWNKVRDYIMNPVTAMMMGYVIIGCIFKLLGWEEAL